VRGRHDARVHRALRRFADATNGALLDSRNTKLELLTRLVYAFHSHAPLIALAKLEPGGLCPPLARPAWAIFISIAPKKCGQRPHTRDLHPSS